MREQNTQVGVAIEDTREDKARDSLSCCESVYGASATIAIDTCDGCLKGEPECKGKDMPVVLVSPLLSIDTIVRVKENDEACLLQCSPNRF